MKNYQVKIREKKKIEGIDLIIRGYLYLGEFSLSSYGVSKSVAYFIFMYNQKRSEKDRVLSYEAIPENFQKLLS